MLGNTFLTTNISLIAKQKASPSVKIVPFSSTLIKVGFFDARSII